MDKKLKVPELQRRRLKRWVLKVSPAIFLVPALLAGSGVPVQGQDAPTQPAQQAAVLGEFSRAVRELVEEVSPGVVEIFVRRYSQPDDLLIPSAQLLSHERTQGSGVLLSGDGYILTNAHLVHRARSIRIRLAKSEPEDPSRTSVLRNEGTLLSAALLGTDAETDLAILKADLEGAHFLELGDSEALDKGELVLAFGSPRGLGDSVTMGVVSASARQLRPEDPMIYIQTDAPINPGSSGGPLVNMRGEVVGINTFIFSQSGGNEGIGFAAPSNIARHVYTELRDHGFVRRSRLGIRIQTVNSILARGLGLPREWGVIVSDIRPGSLASLTDLEIGDLILSMDGKVVENARQLEVNVYPRRPGEMVQLEVQRDNRRFQVSLPVLQGDEVDEEVLRLASPEENLVRELGILAIEIDREITEHLPRLRQPGGILVAARSLDAPYLAQLSHSVE